MKSSVYQFLRRDKTPPGSGKTTGAGFSALLVLCWGMFSACADFHLQIEEGYKQLEAGNFDAALERFQRSSMESPENPRVLAGLGLVLSLRRVSQLSALKLLKTSLKKKPNNRVRWELLTLYMNMGLYEEARVILSPKWIPIEKYFDEDMRLLREGVACMRRPSRYALQALRGGPESTLREYFLTRCLLRRKQYKKAFASFRLVKNRKLRCELLASISETDFKAEKFKYRETLIRCRNQFPGSVVLHRERPGLLSRDPGRKRNARRFYYGDSGLPPYTPPEDEWRFANVKEEYYDRISIRVKLEKLNSERGNLRKNKTNPEPGKTP